MRYSSTVQECLQGVNMQAYGEDEKLYCISVSIWVSLYLMRVPPQNAHYDISPKTHPDTVPTLKSHAENTKMERKTRKTVCTKFPSQISVFEEFQISSSSINSRYRGRESFRWKGLKIETHLFPIEQCPCNYDTPQNSQPKWKIRLCRGVWYLLMLLYPLRLNGSLNSNSLLRIRCCGGLDSGLGL